jgi:gliding motility-associated-like protein
VDKDGDGIGANADLDDNNAIIGEERAIIPADAFTPNVDVINETYLIQGNQNHPNAMVTVYNRYGHEVFKPINYQNDWTGRNGSGSGMLPAGSYYYVIYLRNGSTPMDGWIFINY